MPTSTSKRSDRTLKETLFGWSKKIGFSNDWKGAATRFLLEIFHHLNLGVHL